MIPPWVNDPTVFFPDSIAFSHDPGGVIFYTTKEPPRMTYNTAITSGMIANQILQWFSAVEVKDRASGSVVVLTRDLSALTFPEFLSRYLASSLVRGFYGPDKDLQPGLPFAAADKRDAKHFVTVELYRNKPYGHELTTVVWWVERRKAEARAEPKAEPVEQATGSPQGTFTGSPLDSPGRLFSLEQRLASLELLVRSLFHRNS